MRRRRSLVPLALLFAAGCAKTDASPQNDVAKTVDVAALKDSIQAREREWSAAFLAGNSAAVAAMYTADAASVQPVGDWSRGRDGIAKTIQSQLDTVAVTSREDITEEVIPAGDYVIEIGHYSFQGTSKSATKAPRSGAGRYVAIWKRDADGAWRIHRDLGNEAPVKPPTAAAPNKKS
jgi:uncharacterized protein (TIGR02246 family)